MKFFPQLLPLSRTNHMFFLNLTRGKHLPLLLSLTVVLAALISALSALHHSPSNHTSLRVTSAVEKETQAKLNASYGQLPLQFMANAGQADAQIKFSAQGQGYGLYLKPSEALLTLSKLPPRNSDRGAAADSGGLGEKPAYRPIQTSELHLRLKDATTAPSMSGLDELPGKVNYLIGNNPDKWRTNIATYKKVLYKDVYPGIDLLYYGNQGHLEYDFVVGAGSNPRRIEMVFGGVEDIRTDENGDLLLSTPAGEIRQRKPLAYQESGGVHREVAANYHVKGERISFELGDYDHTRPLVIDPVLVYSTLLGGSGYEEGRAIAVDAQGSAYLTGSSNSADFPQANTSRNANDIDTDAFIAKLNPAGTALEYTTFLGGSDYDGGYAIALDSQGSAYAVGYTNSTNFPHTASAFQKTKDNSTDAFITKLSPSGSSLIYSSFLGGDNTDLAYGVAVGSDGHAVVVGETDSTRFGPNLPLQRNGNPVYKSTDSAEHWIASGAGVTPSSVTDFAVDPGNSNVVYANSSSGVFKSTDGGAHWSLTGTARPSTAPVSTNDVVVHPSNSSIIYAASTDNGIYKSSDGGATYEQKNTGLFVLSVNVLAIDPTTPNTLYAGTINGIFKSTNGGDNWTKVDNGIIFNAPGSPESLLTRPTRQSSI